MGFQLYENGKLLGRDANSWIRILGFYAVYYSFLGFLIYFAVGQYASRMPAVGGSAPKIVTRTDMPGAGVWPFHSIDASNDKDGELHLSSKNENAEGNDLYRTHLTEFFESYANDEAVSCKLPENNPEKNTCKVPNASFLSEQDINQSIKDKKPIVAVAVNKVFNWNPINRSNKLDNGQFVANSVQMRCFETGSDGSPVENSKFSVSVIGTEKAILPSYYPYTAQDKLAEGEAIQYNKPFLLAQINPLEDDAWVLNTDQKLKYFRCELLADNIQKPLVGADFYQASDAVKSWSNDLNKLGIGFVQFAFTMQ